MLSAFYLKQSLKTYIMKNIIIILVLLVSPIAIVAQKNQPIVKDTLEVKGNCNHCKERIENAALLPGVKFAEWDKETGLLAIVYKSEKVTREEIEKSIASVGYEAGATPADSVAYDQLPGCCQYKTGASCGH